MLQNSDERRKRTPRRPFTDRLVSALTSNCADQFEHYDGFCPGLLLRVSRSGTKTWCFTFRNPVDGKRARLQIGQYPMVSLALARERGFAAKTKVTDGKDPRIVPVLPVDKTMGELIEDRLRMEVRGKLRTADEIERAFNKDVIPVVGKVPVKAFSMSHLNKILDPIDARGKMRMKGLLYQYLTTLFDFAIRRGEITHSPIAKAAIPHGIKVKERNLSHAEVRAVWRELPHLLAGSDYIPTIIRLALATGQRLSEVAGMRRHEIDQFEKIWTIPGSRTKNGHDHVVPLNAIALSLVLDAMRDAGNGDILFPNKSGEEPLDRYAVGHAVRRVQGRFKTAKVANWTTHDLGRTFSTLASENLGILDLIIAHVINHRSVTKASITARVYNKNTYLKEKRDALDKWGVWLDKLVSDGAMEDMREAA